MTINSSEAELKELYKSILRVKGFILFLISFEFMSRKITKAYENDLLAVNLFASQRNTPRLRHVDIPVRFLHNEQSKVA